MSFTYKRITLEMVSTGFPEFTGFSGFPHPGSFPIGQAMNFPLDNGNKIESTKAKRAAKKAKRAAKKAKVEALEKATIEALEKAKIEAAEKAKIEAEEKAKIEAEEKVKIEVAENSTECFPLLDLVSRMDALNVSAQSDVNPWTVTFELDVRLFFVLLAFIFALVVTFLFKIGFHF